MRAAKATILELVKAVTALTKMASRIVKMMKRGTWNGLAASKQQAITRPTTSRPTEATIIVIEFPTNDL